MEWPILGPSISHNKIIRHAPYSTAIRVLSVLTQWQIHFMTIAINPLLIYLHMVNTYNLLLFS